MLTATGWLGGHPEEGTLLCFSDRGLSAVEQEETALHLRDCEHCQLELASIEGLARAFSAALTPLGVEAVSDLRRASALAAVRQVAQRHARRRAVRTVWVPRLAAASLVVLAGSLAAGPGLALVRDLMRSTRPATVVAEPAVVMAVPAITDRAAASSTAQIEWTTPQFALVFDRAGGGSIEFREHSFARASLKITHGSEQIGVVGGAEGFRIENSALGAPLYVLALPSQVSRLTVKVGNGASFVINPQSGISYDVSELARGRLTEIGRR
jgi:hypothetical protein